MGSLSQKKVTEDTTEAKEQFPPGSLNEYDDYDSEVSGLQGQRAEKTNMFENSWSKKRAKQSFQGKFKLRHCPSNMSFFTTENPI